MHIYVEGCDSFVKFLNRHLLFQERWNAGPFISSHGRNNPRDKSTSTYMCVVKRMEKSAWFVWVKESQLISVVSTMKMVCMGERKSANIGGEYDEER